MAASSVAFGAIQVADPSSGVHQLKQGLASAVCPQPLPHLVGNIQGVSVHANAVVKRTAEESPAWQSGAKAGTALMKADALNTSGRPVAVDACGSSRTNKQSAICVETTPLTKRSSYARKQVNSPVGWAKLITSRTYDFMSHGLVGMTDVVWVKDVVCPSTVCRSTSISELFSRRLLLMVVTNLVGTVRAHGLERNNAVKSSSQA